MDYTINIDHENRIIHYHHTGIITKESIGEAWGEFLGKEEFTALKYNLLSDYTDTTSTLDVDDVDLIVGFLFKIKDILKGKKQAHIIDRPLDTALSLLFETDANKKVGFIVKTFSSKEAGKKWLIR